MKTWSECIADCIENENKRFLLKDIPLIVAASREYILEPIEWVIYIIENKN